MCGRAAKWWPTAMGSEFSWKAVEHILQDPVVPGESQTLVCYNKYVLSVPWLNTYYKQLTFGDGSLWPFYWHVTYLLCCATSFSQIEKNLEIFQVF